MRTTDIFGLMGSRWLGQAEADPAYMALPELAPNAPLVDGYWRSVDPQGRKIVIMWSHTGSPGGVQSGCEAIWTYDDWVKMGRKNICPPGSGQPPAAPAPSPAPAPGAPAPIPGAPPSGCNIPAGYGPDAAGNPPAGKAVYACLQPDGTYNVFNQADNSPVMSQVSAACLAGFAGVNLLQPGDPRCAGAPPPGAPGAPPAGAPSVVSNPGAAPLTYPIQNMWFPESLEPPPIRPVGIPAAAPAPIPAAAPPVPPMPKYAPGQPIPVTDWFGICIQKARGL